MRILLFALLTLSALPGADDSWAKVRELKSGTELRVYKRGARQPILVKMDEATADSLLAVTKNEQIAIAKDQIDRIDYRPAATGGRLTARNKIVTGDPATEVIPQSRPHEASVPRSSTSSTVSLPSKPDFETIYRRGKKIE